MRNRTSATTATRWVIFIPLDSIHWFDGLYRDLERAALWRFTSERTREKGPTVANSTAADGSKLAGLSKATKSSTLGTRGFSSAAFVGSGSISPARWGSTRKRTTIRDPTPATSAHRWFFVYQYCYCLCNHFCTFQTFKYVSARRRHVLRCQNRAEISLVDDGLDPNEAAEAVTAAPAIAGEKDSSAESLRRCFVSLRRLWYIERAVKAGCPTVRLGKRIIV